MGEFLSVEGGNSGSTEIAAKWGNKLKITPLIKTIFFKPYLSGGRGLVKSKNTPVFLKQAPLLGLGLSPNPHRLLELPQCGKTRNLLSPENVFVILQKFCGKWQE